MSTPLKIASQNGHVEVVNRLLEHGASADSQDKVHNYYTMCFSTPLFSTAHIVKPA